MEYQSSSTRTLSTRLSIREFTLVNEYCKRMKSNPSTLIKDLLFEEINPEGVSAPANLAGKNIFEYDRKRDIFSWIIELDDGKRVEVLKGVSPEYLKELCNNISSTLTNRDELQGKRRKNSVPVPKKLLKGIK